MKRYVRLFLAAGVLVAGAAIVFGATYPTRPAAPRSRNPTPGHADRMLQQFRADDETRRALVKAARALESQGRLPEAARAYRTAVDTGETVSPDLERFGNELRRLGDATGAKRAYEMGAVRGDTGASRCTYRLAVLAADEGDYAGAVLRYRTAKEEYWPSRGKPALPFRAQKSDMDRLKAACYSEMGETHSITGASGKAFPYYAESVRLAPDEPWQVTTYLGLASGYVRREQLGEAAAAARKAHALARAGSDEALIGRAARKAESLQALVRSREMGRRLQSGWKPDIAPVPGVGDKNRPEFRVQPDRRP